MTTKDNLRYLNTDFRVVYNREKTATEPRVRYLIGRRGLISLLGELGASRVVSIVYKKHSRVHTCVFGDGSQIIFYSKWIWRLNY